MAKPDEHRAPTDHAADRRDRLADRRDDRAEEREDRLDAAEARLERLEKRRVDPFQLLGYVLLSAAFIFNVYDVRQRDEDARLDATEALCREVGELRTATVGTLERQQRAVREDESVSAVERQARSLVIGEQIALLRSDEECP